MSNEQELERRATRFSQVNSVSPSFCLAKWLQATVHLHNGYTHSCHHPVPHKIPLKEVKKDCRALTNTKHILKQRKVMLKGKQPKECNYCWNIEGLGKGHVSDRCYKSTDDWAFESFGSVLDAGKEKINPTYLEVSFENTCNFKCVYCQPEISSKWMEEIKKFGPIQQSDFPIYDPVYLKRVGKMPYDRDELNPYVEAFWEWWPSLYPSLDTFRITGGEPLLSKNTWQVLDWIESHPRSQLSLAVNSNLGVPDPLIDKFIKYHNLLNPGLRSFEIFTSFESVGVQAEYIRHGMKYDRFIGNIERLLKETDCRVNIMVTFNLLSVPGFEGFLKKIFDLRSQYNEADAYNRIPIMIAYLRAPTAFDMRILPEDIKAKYSEAYIRFAEEHTKYSKPGESGRIYLEEVDQVKRLANYMATTPDDLKKRRRDFAYFIRELDMRRQQDFRKVFPELVDFYNQCESLIK